MKNTLFVFDEAGATVTLEDVVGAGVVAILYGIFDGVGYFARGGLGAVIGHFAVGYLDGEVGLA